MDTPSTPEEPTGQSLPAPAPPPPHLRLWALFVTVFVNRGERRLRAGWRLAVQSLGLVLVSVLVRLGAMLLFPLLARVVPSLRQAFAGNMRWYVGVVLSTLVATLTVFAARWLIDRRPLPGLGLRLDRHVLPDVAFGFVAAALMEGTIFAIHVGAGWIASPSFVWETVAPGTVATRFAAMIAVFALVGWYEELLMRGYWLTNLADGLGPTLAVVISSLVFSAGHFLNPNAGVIPLLGLIFAGLFLALAYVRSGQLWLGIGLHWGWNLFEGPVFGFPVSGMSLFTLVDHRVRGPEIVTGGAFGPEAGLVQFPALALGVLLVVLYTRGRAGLGRRAAQPARVAGEIPSGSPPV